MNFLHISDMHFLRDYSRVPGDFHSVLTRMTPPVAQLDALLARVQTKPEFVLFSGDLCERGEAADYRALGAALRARFPGVPIFATPGNHDAPDAHVPGLLDRGARVAVKRFGELRVVLLDSTDPAYPDGRLTDRDCDLLDAALAETNAPALLVTHHHLIDGQFTLPPARFPERFRAIVQNSGLLAIFNGHTHHSHFGVFAGKPCYTAGSLSFRGKTRAGEVLFDECAAVHVCHLSQGALSVRVLAKAEPARELAAIALPIR